MPIQTNIGFGRDYKSQQAAGGGAASEEFRNFKKTLASKSLLGNTAAAQQDSSLSANTGVPAQQTTQKPQSILEMLGEVKDDTVLKFLKQAYSNPYRGGKFPEKLLTPFKSYDDAHFYYPLFSPGKYAPEDWLTNYDTKDFFGTTAREHINTLKPGFKGGVGDLLFYNEPVYDNRFGINVIGIDTNDMSNIYEKPITYKPKHMFSDVESGSGKTYKTWNYIGDDGNIYKTTAGVNAHEPGTLSKLASAVQGTALVIGAPLALANAIYGGASAAAAGGVGSGANYIAGMGVSNLKGMALNALLGEVLGKDKGGGGDGGSALGSGAGEDGTAATEESKEPSALQQPADQQVLQQDNPLGTYGARARQRLSSASALYSQFMQNLKRPVQQRRIAGLMGG